MDVLQDYQRWHLIAWVLEKMIIENELIMFAILFHLC